MRPDFCRKLNVVVGTLAALALVVQGAEVEEGQAAFHSDKLALVVVRSEVEEVEPRRSRSGIAD